jgi:mono/diheme cytochrome c family protein
MMNSERQSYSSSLRTLFVLCASALSFCLAFYASSKARAAATQESVSFRGQTQEEADRKSSGCVSCHTSTDEPTMHPTKTVHLGCTDCHGGNSAVSVASGAALNSPEYNSAKEKAHVQPRDSSFKNRSALPERTFTKWLKESVEYIRFVNLQ